LYTTGYKRLAEGGLEVFGWRVFLMGDGLIGWQLERELPQNAAAAAELC
jgi:hypothetical protein